MKNRLKEGDLYIYFELTCRAAAFNPCVTGRPGYKTFWPQRPFPDLEAVTRSCSKQLQQ